MGTATLTVLRGMIELPDATLRKAFKHHFVLKHAANSMEGAQLACQGALTRHMVPGDGGNDQTLRSVSCSY